MKKILIAFLVLILIATAILFFWKDGRNKISDFFTENADFGSFFDIDPQSQNEPLTPPPPVDDTPINPGPYLAPVLRQISLEPVSGFTFYATTSTSTRVSNTPDQGEVIEEFLATSTAIRFQERATGHVYDVFEFLEQPVKASNITVQKIYSALFTNDKNEFLAQTASVNNEYIKTSNVRIIPAKPETATSSSTPQTIEQREISSVISNFAYIADTNKLVYSNRSDTGASVYQSNTARGEEKLVAKLPFNDLTIDSINANQVLIQTKSSATALGYAYALSLSNGSVSKVIGDIAGLLVKASPDLKYYIYSQSDNNQPIIRGHNSETDSTFRIGIYTIPEKCTFSTKNTAIAYCFGSNAYVPALYPDDWYKGRVFNSEDLYKIDLTTGAVETVYVFDNDKPFDVIRPMLTTNDEIMVFQSKYDLTLWAIDLAALDNQF